jgi:hypothetical protein
LHTALKQESVVEPASLLNRLLPLKGDKFAELAEHVLTDVRDLPVAQIAFADASADVLQRATARDALFRAAWENERDGRPWVMRQLLGSDFAAHFTTAESNRDRQLKLLGRVNPVLNGKVVHSTTSAASKSTFFLQIAAREFPGLPVDVEPSPWAAESESVKTITELQRRLGEVQTTAVEPYRATLAAFQTYADELRQLTAATFEIATVYDITIAKQLPGALREMKTSIVPSWDFRFPITLVETFRREDAKYQSLSRSLPKLRATLPWSLQTDDASAGGDAATSKDGTGPKHP